MPTTSSTGRRTLISLSLALMLGAAVVGGLGATGGVRFVPDPITGEPLALVEGIPGPESGPTCSLDKRYVDEPPTGLRADVAEAFQKLRAKAGEAGVKLCVQDGKRSVDQQEREFAEAVRRFGNKQLASRYVLTPDKSMHVKGIAVDIQPVASAAWVERNGRAVGWCRRYANEEWHFEFDPAWISGGCPALLPSATGS